MQGKFYLMARSLVHIWSYHFQEVGVAIITTVDLGKESIIEVAAKDKNEI